MAADLLKHAPDLPVLAFNERHFIPGIGGVFGQADLGRRGEDLLEPVRPSKAARLRTGLCRSAADTDSAAELFNVLCRGPPGDLYQISFLNVRCSARQAAGEVAIVGQEQ